MKTVGGNFTALAAFMDLELTFEDASCYGELSSQDGYFGRHGICIRRSIWPFHVKRMSCTNENKQDENRIVAKS